MEDNKEVSITQNGTVEITPTEGKDGMKKVTATVNVPSTLSVSNELPSWASGLFFDCVPPAGVSCILIQEIQLHVFVGDGQTKLLDMVAEYKGTSPSNLNIYVNEEQLVYYNDSVEFYAEQIKG